LEINEESMRIKNKLLAKSFIIGLVLVVLVSIIGIMTMSRTHVVLQGQIETTEIRISGKLPGRVDSFLVVEGQSESGRYVGGNQ
jgi:HlyD family secretion protein